MRRGCTRKPQEKPSVRCAIVNVSHLYEYLAVTEIHVTDDFALAGATAYCVCGTGR